MTQPQLKLLRSRRKAARRQMRRHDDSVRLRRELERALEQRGWTDIRVRTARMTIGEAYNRARLFEAIVTYRGTRPALIPLLQAVMLVTKTCKHKSEVHTFRALRSLSSEWRRERKPVQHPKWRG